MADSLRILRGNKSDMPANLGAGVIALCLDTKEVYVGDGVGNLKFGMFDKLLPLTGGTVQRTGLDSPLRISGTAVRAMTVYTVNGASKGGLGFDANGKPITMYEGVGYYELLNTYNKPTGSYTGNGDATERLIKSAGLGNVVLIWVSGSPDKVTLVTPAGSFVKDSSGITGLQSFSAYVNGGNLHIISTHANLNASGVIYEYQFI